VEAGKKVEVNVEILLIADRNVMPVLTVGTMGFNVDNRNTGTSFTLTAGVNTITNHSGGLIWLSFVQDGSTEPKGKAKITFTEKSEHVRAPRYVFGVTTDAEFLEMMDAYRTPDVLYHSDYIAVAATRAAAQQYSLNENKSEWMASIHTLLEKEDEISGMDNNDANPVHHRLKTGEVRFLLVENTSSSPHASSSGYTGYPNGSRHRYLTKLGTVSNNSWMLGHELGHQHQQPAYQINQATESTVNIYSYVVERAIQGPNYNRTSALRWGQTQNSYLKLPFSKRIYDMPDSQLESITGFNRDELRFMVWEQLFLIFGDQFYKTLHRVVREEKVISGGADERRAYLIWKASQVSGYDLTEFFNQWGIRATDEQVKAKLRARMGDALTKGSIVPLPKTVEECTMVTGQNRPAWIPMPLRGITSSSPENVTNLIDRSNWKITASIEGASDDVVGGDNVMNMIDDNTTTAFSFVKPGKTYGNITAPTDYIPSFIIDMQNKEQFNYVGYMHRIAGGNTSVYIRARQLSVYGSDDNTTFIPVKEHYVIDPVKNENEILIEFPEVSYRYVRVVIEDWDKANGSTIQVAEFSVGTKIPEKQLPVPEPLKFKVNVATGDGIITSQAGLHMEDEDSNYTINFTLSPGAKDPVVTLDGDVIEPTVNNNTYSLTVKVTNHLEISISASIGTGLESVLNNPKVRVYPNPVKAGQPFYINPDSELSGSTIRIYTISGVKISEQNINGDFAILNIDKPGIYLIEIIKYFKKYMSKIIVN
jgi:hypothetical protein